MTDPFDHIFGQPRVREFLRQSVANERITHAYLFTGPAGSNKTQAAYALAMALLCENGGCGTCDTCKRIMRKSHPDVRMYSPEGASGYLVDQVRDLVADMTLAPISASRKIYILDRVDLLGVSAANAFLKSLEEPPESIVLILLGRTLESVLPTIASRCSIVPFRHIPASEAAAIITQKTAATAEQAHIAIQACGGSLTRSMEFLASSERQAFRMDVLEVLGRLPHADTWDLLKFAKELTVAVNAPLDSVRAVQEEDLAQNADFLSKSALRQIEARNKRALTAQTQEMFSQLLTITSAYLRDILVLCAHTPDLVVNVDVILSLKDTASRTNEAYIIRALDAVAACGDAFSYNVSPETCIGAMLIEIREALYGTNSSRAIGV